MKAKTLKELLGHVSDDAEIYLASEVHDYWQNTFVNPAHRLEAETVVWDSNGGSYRLLKEGQSVRDYHDDENRLPLQVLVLK